MRRDAVRQLEKLGQPSVAIRGKGFNIDPGIGAANDSTNGNGDDINQKMQFEMVTPWVTQVSEMLANSESPSVHRSPPWVPSERPRRNHRCHSLSKTMARCKIE